MKLEFDSVEELIIFYKKYIEPIQVPEPKQQKKEHNNSTRDLVEKTKRNNEIDTNALKKILS